MIYLFYQGEKEERYVTAVFDAPDTLDVSLHGFLLSLGLRPMPRFDPDTDVMAWHADFNRWIGEKEALLQERGMADGESAHRQWLEAHPQVRCLNFEPLD